jgi:hypothetical protein
LEIGFRDQLSPRGEGDVYYYLKIFAGRKDFGFPWRPAAQGIGVHRRLSAAYKSRLR